MNKECAVTENNIYIDTLGKKQQTKILNTINIKEHEDSVKRKAFIRDKFTCQCCKRGGDKYIDILDVHHIIPLEFGGDATVENSVTLCVACHRLIHLYSTRELYIDKAFYSSYDKLTDRQKKQYQSKMIFDDEKRRFERIIVLGSIIRKSIVTKGMNKDKNN